MLDILQENILYQFFCFLGENKKELQVYPWFRWHIR